MTTPLIIHMNVFMCANIYITACLYKCVYTCIKRVCVCVRARELMAT